MKKIAVIVYPHFSLYEVTCLTEATSLIRTIEPSGFARTTISSNSFTVDKRPGAVIGKVTSTSSTGCLPSSPAADSRFWSFKASCKSLTVNPMLANRSGYTQICIP